MHEIDVSIPRTERDFVDTVIAKADVHGIKVILSNTRHVKYGGMESNGFFVDRPNGILAVAWNQDSYERSLRILVHESSHMDQWVELCPEWVATTVADTDAMTILDLWFNRLVELTAEQLYQYATASRDVELDCEKRSVEKIIKWNLPINVDTYIKEANSYVNFYNVIPLTRKWYTIGREPYNTPEILERMSTKFDMNYHALTADILDPYCVLFPELKQPNGKFVGET